MKKDLYIFGAGELGKIILYHFFHSGLYNIKGFVVDDSFFKENNFCDLPVYKESEFLQINKNGVEIFIALGPKEMNRSRKECFEKYLDRGYQFASFIGKNVICESEIGKNCFIGHGTIINPFVNIGNNNIIWEGCIISNNVNIGDHNYISPAVNIGTFCEVKDQIIIGTNSTIKTRVIIEEKSLIGSSCYISQNTIKCGVYGEKTTKCYGDRSELIDISM